MFFFFVRSFTATAHAEIWRQVTCEKCECEYVYLHRLTAKHSEASFYGANDDAARAQAPYGAQARLAYLAKNAVEPVACPECGYLQADMCEEIRKRRFGWMRTAGFFCMCAAITAGLFPLTEGSKDDKPPAFSEFHPYMYSACVFFALLMTTLFFGQSVLWSRYDLNSLSAVLKRQGHPDDRAIPIARFRTQHPDAQLFR